MHPFRKVTEEGGGGRPTENICLLVDQLVPRERETVGMVGRDNHQRVLGVRQLDSSADGVWHGDRVSQSAPGVVVVVGVVNTAP